MKSFVESLFQSNTLLSDCIGTDFTKTPLQATAEDFDRIIGVNIRGTFLCYK